jgi:hypothetical protein
MPRENRRNDRVRSNREACTSKLYPNISLVSSSEARKTGNMNIKKAPKTRIIIALIAFVAMAAGTLLVGMPASAQKGGKKSDSTKVSTPGIQCEANTEVSINIKVTAGPTGAPAGFSLQWITAEQYAFGPDGLAETLDDNSWPASDSPNLCKASFSGNANLSRYNLEPGEMVSVNAGEFLFDNGASSNCVGALECGTTYVFRAFAHATSTLFRSDFTANLTCSTLPCEEEDGGCTFTQGYWKTHGPIPTGNNTNEWPVTSLTLGSVSYTDLELQAIFDTPAAGNGLIALAHQLIAAKLNVANGADDSAIAAAIAAADALIGGLVIPPVGAGSLPNSATSALTSILTQYNEGAIGPGHCD